MDAPELGIFSDLDPKARAGLAAEFASLSLARGAVLISEGERADHLYLVLSGRFVVTRADRTRPLNEIGPGQPIGEIAFFAGGQRTATVTALRDSIVLRLARGDYDSLAARLPSINTGVTALLARRLAETSIGRAVVPDPRPRTMVVVRAGSAPLHHAFLGQLVGALGAAASVLVLDAKDAQALVPPGTAFDSDAATEILNQLERRYDYVVYVTDPDATPWSLKAIRQADLALLVGMHSADPTLGPLEHIAAAFLPPQQTRLVLLHDHRGRIAATNRWLAQRRVAMHHHVALNTPSDLARLVRFIDGTALGLIAGGGGAFCVAHAGVYKALQEAGYSFDMMGGTSGGSAMTAAFAMGSTPEQIDAAIHTMFVVNKAMRRYTWPRYGLLDHTHYDEQLASLCDGLAIEDLWLPYFSVSTNLSENRLHQHRTGPLWQAVRASSSIPVLLPPFYTTDGDMLVDGGLIDNVPLRVMHEHKSGPNVVISLEAPKLARFPVDYAALPARGALLRSLANPFGGRSRLPQAPGIGTVLLRALVAHRQDYERHLTPNDLHLMPPLPADMGLLDWHRHRDVTNSAYLWAKAQLSQDAAASRPQQ